MLYVVKNNRPRRLSSKQIAINLSQFPVFALLGLRQVGKTTLARQLRARSA
jgi:predicted AAA+ superfamily ATPase